MPQLSLDERLILRATERKDYFDERWNRASSRHNYHPSIASTSEATSAGGDHHRYSQQQQQQQQRHGSIIHSPSIDSITSATNDRAEILDSVVAPSAANSQFTHSASSGSISSIASGSRNHAVASSGDHSFSSSTASAEGSLQSRSRANTVTSSEDGFNTKQPFLSGLGMFNNNGPNSGGASSATSFSFGGLGSDGSNSIADSAAASRSITPSANYNNIQQHHSVKDTHWFDSRITFNNMTIPIRIPVYTFPEEIGDVSF